MKDMRRWQMWEDVTSETWEDVGCEKMWKMWDVKKYFVCNSIYTSFFLRPDIISKKKTPGVWTDHAQTKGFDIVCMSCSRSLCWNYFRLCQKVLCEVNCCGQKQPNFVTLSEARPRLPSAHFAGKYIKRYSKEVPNINPPRTITRFGKIGPTKQY